MALVSFFYVVLIFCAVYSPNTMTQPAQIVTVAHAISSCTPPEKDLGFEGSSGGDESWE